MLSRVEEKNDFVFFVGTSSLEARNIKCVNRILSIVQKSKSNCQSLFNFVSNHRFHVGLFHTFLDRPLKASTGVFRLGFFICPGTSSRIFHSCHQFSFNLILLNFLMYHFRFRKLTCNVN